MTDVFLDNNFPPNKQDKFSSGLAACCLDKLVEVADYEFKQQVLEEGFVPKLLSLCHKDRYSAVRTEP